MNPRYGDFDTYHMAASAIDEALRNAVAVGADPARIAILDNFCWGYTDRAETLGSLVRAAIACRDLALAYGAPFISGKDSLNNEFTYEGPDGERQTIAIPPSLLISAMGQVDDVRHCVTMDLKRPGNVLLQVGGTKDELGGSHFALLRGLEGGDVPRVDLQMAPRTLGVLHRAIATGLVRSCHDLSEGGLAVAIAEMAFAGGLGVELDLAELLEVQQISPTVALYSESNSRFLVEVEPARLDALRTTLGDVPCQLIGRVTAAKQLRIVWAKQELLVDEVDALKQIWQAPLDW
jgi:phosphoribosylformylglycinamidine synthase